MARQKATEKPSRESFTLNADNERDRAVKLFLSYQNNKAETIKNILYNYIKNDGANNSTINNTKNNIKFSTKNNENINNSTKIDTNNSTNNSTKKEIHINNDAKIGVKNNIINDYVIKIEENDDEQFIIEEESKSSEQALENALKGLGV